MSTLAIMHSLRRPNGYWWKHLSVSRLLAGIAFRYPGRMKRAHVHVIVNVRRTSRIARKGMHFMSYSLINSVPSPGITSRRLIKLRVCFQ
jgi:hypothetical protein